MSVFICRVILDHGDYLALHELESQHRYTCDKALLAACRIDDLPRPGEVISIYGEVLSKKFQKVEHYKFTGHQKFTPTSDYPNHYC